MRSLSVGCHRTHEATHMEMAVDLPMSLSTLGDRYFSFGLFHAWFNNSTGYTRRVAAKWVSLALMLSRPCQGAPPLDKKGLEGE